MIETLDQPDAETDPSSVTARAMTLDVREALSGKLFHDGMERGHSPKA